MSLWSLPHLTESDREHLVLAAEMLSVASGEVIVRQGTHPKALFLLLEGVVQVVFERDRSQQPGLLMGPGSLIGEMSFVSGEPASATVTAVSASRLSRVSAAAITAIAERDPGFPAGIYQGLAQLISARLRERNAAWLNAIGQASFAVPAWDGTLAGVRTVELPPPAREYVDRYERVGERSRFLWKWCWRGIEETTLRSTAEEWRQHIHSTKFLAFMLNVMLDDLADRPGCEERFDQAVQSLKPHGEAGSDLPLFGPHEEDDSYLALLQELWCVVGARVAQMPVWHHYARLWDFDCRQVYNATRYCTLARRYPGMDNLDENRTYLPYNSNMMAFATLDLMACDADPADVGHVRETVSHAQSMAQIGNMIATWKREAPERDFSSRVFALATDEGIVDREQLQTLTPEEIIARVEAGGIEGRLLQECRQHRARMDKPAARTHTVDLDSLIRGVEHLFAMTLASRSLL